MNRFSPFSCSVALILAVATWTAPQHAHGQGEHDHGDGSTHQHGTEGHDHGDTADAGNAHAGDAASVAVTQWTDAMELFMEYPRLVAGEPGRFIVHLTILESFQPVRDGIVTLRFRDAGGGDHKVVSGDLLRDGIFAPTVRLPEAGTYEFDLFYLGSAAQGAFQIEGFSVTASTGANPPGAAQNVAGEITFLKEQQWMVPFATTTAEVREIKRGVWAIGEVLPAPAAYVEIAAPVDGIVQFSGDGGLALPGAQVSRGDKLASISPPLQGDSWAASRLAYEQAERNLARARRLREKDAISEREFEETRNDYLARKAGHERLAGSGRSGLLTLNSPLDGKIIDWQVRPGQRVQAGDMLMTVADPSVVWLRVNVYERDFRDLGNPVGAFVNSDAAAGGWTISPGEMQVLTTGGALDPVTRTIPVLLEVANGEGRLTIHESTPVELYASEGTSATAVPRTAVYEDDGLEVVFVQTGGESFAKRIVTVGPHHAGWVSIRAGLDPGERVVTEGGYHVKLAATTAEIGHGHTH